MSHKEHHLLRIWTDAPSATWKVKKELDHVPCCGGMPGWEATAGPASHTYSTGPRDRQRTEAWPDSPCLLVAPQNHRSPEDCCKWLYSKSNLWQPHWLGERRCTKPIWGLCSGPLASITWLACQAVGQDLMLWLSTVMLCRSYKQKQRISQQEDYCNSPF